MRKTGHFILAFFLLFTLAASAAIFPQNREAASPGALNEPSSRTRRAENIPITGRAISPVDSVPLKPVFVEIDHAILAEYAGTYDLRPTAFLQFKVEEDTLWLRLMDGKTWDPLFAESEITFCMQAEESIRFEFVQDESGDVSILNFEYQGIKFPPGRKMKPQ